MEILGLTITLYQNLIYNNAPSSYVQHTQYKINKCEIAPELAEGEKQSRETNKLKMINFLFEDAT